MAAVSFTDWRKAARSGGGGACVEVGRAQGLRGLRDTKLGLDSPVIAVTSGTFDALVAALRADQFHG